VKQILNGVSVVLICVMLAMPDIAAAGRDAADTWLAETVAPSVAKQLATHPRFKGQSVRVVVFAENRPAALSNMLAMSFRDHLADAVIDVPGIRLISAPPPDNAPNCSMDEAHYLVGLQISPLSNDQARIDLRVLDAEDGAWVSGFDLSWRGTLSRSQRWELTQSRTDPAYRGHRSAPFESTQFDLLAKTIARDLGCQSLRQMHGEYVVLVESSEGSPEALGSVSELIAHNLAAYQSVQFTTDPEQANATLQSKAHTIDSELQQYWATIAPLNPDSDLPTLSANAYVQYGAFGADPFTVPRNGQTVLTSANLVRTSDRVACRSNESDCVAMQIRTSANAVVFFLNHQKSHGLVRLSDSQCRSRTDARVALANQALLQPLPLFSLTPDAASSRPIWTLQPETDTYYAIAVSNSEAAHVLSQHLQKLPQRCTAAARFGLEGDRLESWMREFVQKVTAFEPYVDWQAIQVRNIY
jgi:hypothetical protein